MSLDIKIRWSQVPGAWGTTGVFSIWNDTRVFENVRIGENGDLCPDSVYLQMTGKSAEQLFPALRSTD